ncbi:MAG: hypothetical protein IAX21_02640 [Candidatus Bathyarchaeota archaeon]|nr:hypothetical protein [Candidatus Bathyarchaeum tardum]WGM90089.1 MAG: hypothetical protein NUK63_02935 [Candidatus Bathyarchaeum tardum]WNZ29775.1 MAG: hypothetical protein IAX21_02640 [Candidatus Bathyarchaeota archaeon]
MQTRDLTTIIVMAVLQFVITALIAQMGTIITGIPGTNFLFTILLAIPITFSLLTYEGRRWRIFMQLALFILLAIPTRLGGPAFDPISRLGSLTTAFLIDLLANSIYGFFKNRHKLLWWAVLTSGAYWLMIPFFSTVTKILFYTPEAVESFIGVVSVLLPVIIGQALLGGYIGYQIYKRQTKFR